MICKLIVSTLDFIARFREFIIENDFYYFENLKTKEQNVLKYFSYRYRNLSLFYILKLYPRLNEKFCTLIIP